MKKLAIIALSLIALSACNRDKKRVVAVIPKGNAHLFWQSVHAGAVSTSRETGSILSGTARRQRPIIRAS